MSGQAFLTAVELNVFTTLGARSLTGEELQRALGLHPRGTYDFLDTLVALGFLDRIGDGAAGRYRNTPGTAQFLDRNQPGYIGGMLEMLNARLFGYWNDLGTALKTGQPQNEVKHDQRPMFEVLYSDPARLEQFMSAMRGISGPNFQALADKFDFTKYRSVCDVGGATGQLSTLIAERHPHLACTSFDLQAVEPIAKRWIAKSSTASRVSTAAGDFLKDPLPRADVITIRSPASRRTLQRCDCLQVAWLRACKQARGSPQPRKPALKAPSGCSQLLRAQSLASPNEGALDEHASHEADCGPDARGGCHGPGVGRGLLFESLEPVHSWW